MGNKGFTFGQVATILLVMIGLVAMLVLVTNQLGKAGKASNQIADSVAVSSGSLPGTGCELASGTCVLTKTACTAAVGADPSGLGGTVSKNNFGCESSINKICCFS